MPTENPAPSPSSAGTNPSQQQQQLMQQMLQMFAGGAGGGSATVRFRPPESIYQYNLQVFLNVGFSLKSLKVFEVNGCDKWFVLVIQTLKGDNFFFFLIFVLFVCY